MIRTLPLPREYFIKDNQGRTQPIVSHSSGHPFVAFIGFWERYSFGPFAWRALFAILPIWAALLHAAESSSETANSPGGSFRFQDINRNSLGLFEGERAVFVYNYGIISKPGVPADRNRSSYVHPLYGLDGEILSDDFPKDHYHHRGLFWAWPHVKIGAQVSDLWMLKGVEQRFQHWLRRDASAAAALLTVANGWYVADRKVVDEHVSFRVHPATRDSQSIDVELVLVPLTMPLTLQGAEGKSYGGLTLRFAPRTHTIITTPQGQTADDLPMTRLPWADLSAQFAGRTHASGAAIFIAPDHPDFPPEWLTRHYGVLCVGWPGVEAKTFQPAETIRCRYRIWIHRGAVTVEEVKQAYADWRSTSHYQN